MADRLHGQDLALFRGDRCLFKGLEFAADAGELLVIEGPNGSGKTSLLRAIAGLLEFETGEVRWKGQPLRDNYQGFRAETAWFSHRVGFKSDLTILENLAFEAGLRATSTDREPVFQRLGLERLLDLPFRVLSAGQQRRAALARLLLSRSSLWLMDEPFTNLDTAGQSLVVDLVKDFLADGGTCLMASHQHIDVDGSTRTGDTAMSGQVPGLWQGFAAVVRRDVLLAWKRPGDVLNPLFFFAMVATLFPFAVGPSPEQLQLSGPGVVWVAALLANAAVAEQPVPRRLRGRQPRPANPESAAAAPGSRSASRWRTG